MIYFIPYMNVKNLTNEEKLNEIFRVTEENHDMLRRLHRTQTYTNIFRIFYWLIIIASLGGVYFFVKPIIATFAGNGTGLTETLDKVNSLKSQLPEAKAFQEIFKGAKGDIPASVSTTSGQ